MKDAGRLVGGELLHGAHHVVIVDGDDQLGSGACPAGCGQHYPRRVERFQYLLLLGACLLITLPLELVLGARVYRQPRRLALTLLVSVAAFVAWDVLAIAWDHWQYSDRYVTGWTLPGSLPVEELLFFIVIPLCGLLTLEAVRRIVGR